MTTPTLFPARNPGPLTQDGNNTWLLDGAEPTLIDAGVGARAHIDAIAHALGGRPLARVLVTHGHADHASGVTALRARWPSIETWKWPTGWELGWRVLGDGQRLRAGDREVVVIHTPGHAPDHVCFWDETPRELYAGDMVISGTTVMIPAGRGGDLRAYLASLDRLAGLAPARIFSGHGPVITQPLTLIAEYIAHRRLREEQIIECLTEGITDADAIVARLYPGLDDALRPAALLTVEAHLEKIAEDP